MKYSTFALLSILGSQLVQAVPVPGVVVLTVYQTLYVDSKGNPLTTVGIEPTSTETSSYTSSVNVPISTVQAAVSVPTEPAAPTTSKTTSTVATSTAAATSAPTTGSGETFHGDGTYYDAGLGACGKVNTDSDFIVAISQQRYNKQTPNGNPNNNPLCGQKLNVSYEGKSVQVTIVDSCPGCSYDSLDLSPAAFSQIADKDLGRIQLEWEFASS